MPLDIYLSDGPYMNFPGLAFSSHCEISSINSKVLLQFQLLKLWSAFQMSWKCTCAHTITHASASYPTIHFTSGKKIHPTKYDVQISRLTSYSLNQGCPDLVRGGHDLAGLDHVSTCDHTFLGKSILSWLNRNLSWTAVLKDWDKTVHYKGVPCFIGPSEC